MKIEEFQKKYSIIYSFMFEEVVEDEVKDERKMFDKISEFLFEPRYEVTKLKFKLLG